MAPAVQVPTNFGRHHIGSPTHSNLTLNLKNGMNLRANSLILAFNSPIIENLVATLSITSLDMFDFQERAVSCFIDCAYTGEIEKMEKPIFREMNKMAKVFDVSWLVKKCGEYFGGLVEGMNSEIYEDMLFLFEEACYVFSSLKERVFLDETIEKISSAKAKSVFINKYMEDYNSLSKNQLDVLIELAGPDVHIVVQSLTSQFTRHVAMRLPVLTDNSRHLLNNSDLSCCFQIDRVAFDELFDILQGTEDIPNEDLKWLLTLHRKSTIMKSCSTLVPEPSLPSTKIPNLFHSLEECIIKLPFNGFLGMLADSLKVKNLMMFAEAICIWLRESETDIECTPDMLQKIISIKEARGWNMIPQQCFPIHVGKWKSYKFEAFFTTWRTCDDLVLTEDNHKHIQFVECHNLKDFQGKRLIKEHLALIFYFKHPEIAVCSRPGQCGFVLKTTPGTALNPDLFDIQLSIDPNDYTDHEIHLHEDLVSAGNMHLMLLLKYDVPHCPVSWYNKPRDTLFKSSTGSNYNRAWGWGPFNFDSAQICFNIKIMYNI